MNPSSYTILIVAIMFSLLAPMSVGAHGPGGHGDQDFTPLAAVQKGMQVYDKLVASGKLDSTWETQFSGATVTQRMENDRMEFVVQFTRSEGDPKAVHIFFDDKGQYSGSNFSGK
jgi:hypothetical protein